MKFKYEALNAAGKVVGDVIETTDAAEAIDLLRRRGMFVTEITEAGRGPEGGAKVRGRIGRGRRLKCLAMFSRQLHVLVSTRIPPPESREAWERQVPPGRGHAVLADVRSRVEQGTPLSEAMACHPGYFDTIVRSMVEAGETGGNFAAMLDRMAQLTKKQLHVRSSIIGAMVYPCLLIVVSINVLCTMLLFVLPRFAELFKTLDSPLPPSTK